MMIEIITKVMGQLIQVSVFPFLEIRTYAQILGIKLPEEEDLLYIAR